MSDSSTKQTVIATAERRLRKLDVNITEAIGNVLAQKNWSRQELARRTGLPHSTLSTIMSDNTSSRSWNLNHLMRIAVALGVKLSDIILAAEQQGYTAIMSQRVMLIPSAISNGSKAIACSGVARRLPAKM